MKTRIKLLISLIVALVSILTLAIASSATTYYVTDNAGTSTDDVKYVTSYSDAYSSIADGDTVIIQKNVSGTLDFGKEVTYIIDGDYVWTASSAISATGKTVSIYAKNGDGAFKPNSSMWFNSYSMNGILPTETTWNFGALDANSTMTIDLSSVSTRLIYGTKWKEINAFSGTIISKANQPGNGSSPLIFEATTFNLYENTKIYGNLTNGSLISTTTFNMYGGEIYGNVAVGMWSAINCTSFNMYGGSIHDNYQRNPHNTTDNSNDPQSVGYISTNTANLYDGTIYHNYVTMGHASETKGSVAGIGTRSGSMSLYMVNGAIYENYLVAFVENAPTMGEPVKGEDGLYTCEVLEENIVNKVENEDGTITYSRQYLRSTPAIFNYSIIFKNQDSTVIDAFMIKDDGTVLKSVNGSTEFSVPVNAEIWQATRGATCVGATASASITIENSGTFYAVSHSYSELSICAKKCSVCENVLVEHIENNEKLSVTIKYQRYDENGTKNISCEQNGCTYSESITLEPIIITKGYSIKENGGYGILSSYDVNKNALEEYESICGALEMGVIIANSGEFGSSFMVKDGSKYKLNNSYGFQLPITDKTYNRINCTVADFTSNESALALVMALYVVDEDGVHYIQHENSTLESVSNDEGTLNIVSFAKVAQLLGKDIVLPEKIVAIVDEE